MGGSISSVGVSIVGDRQIWNAIAIEVADRDGVRPEAHIESQRLRLVERSIALAEQHRDGRRRCCGAWSEAWSEAVIIATAATIVGDRQILNAIAIEVAHGHGDREDPHIQDLGLLEVPSAVAPQHRDGVGVLAYYRQIQYLAAVEVAHRHGNGTVGGDRDWRRQRRPEAPTAVAQQHRNGVVLIADDR